MGFGLAAGRAQAQGPPSDRLAPGFYVGADLGGTSYDNACDPAALSCDHTDSAGALFAGYRFDSRFGLELGALDLGKARAVYPRLTSTIDVAGSVDGYDLAALLRFPIGRAWEAYLRGGAFHWDAQTESAEFSASESDWSPSGGAGFAWRFKPAWQLRFQYLYLAEVGGAQTGEANVAMLSAGVSYRFGGRVSETVARAAAADDPPAAPPPAPAPAAAAPAPPPPPLPICQRLPAWDTNVYFPFNSAVPTDLQSLNELLLRLREHTQATVEITGFADSSGARVYNLELSQRRADAVATFLRARGIDERRIAVDWAGAAQPVAGADAAQTAALSRRVRVTSAPIDLADGNCRPGPR